MPRNEEGEFELVVGNRQLLTIVFILMLLFGTVFSMGYFVGRNSAPESASGGGAANPPPAQPGATREPPPVVPNLEPGQASVAPTASKPETGPAKPLETPKTTPAPAKPVESPAAALPPAPVPIAGEEAPATQPAAGQTFLQVAAVRRPEAELMVDVLKRRGFPARIAPVPDKPEFRVLVGPLQDAATLAKTQADLALAGFRSIVRKY